MTCGHIDPGCTKCRLSKRRMHVVPGDGPCDARIVFVGEAPGRDEDMKGVPFVGSAGKMLTAALARAGVARSLVYCTNIVKCRPPDNRKPRKDEISACTGLYLTDELLAIRPRVICPLGQTATEFFIDLPCGMSESVGLETALDISGMRVRLIPSFHPAAVLYQRKKLPEFQRSILASVKAAGLA